MSNQTGTKKATVKIQRFNPDVDKKPYFDEFEVDVNPETTILDALETIKGDTDGTVTFRRSCRHAICGSCAMSVNGANTLVCNQRMVEHVNKRGEVVIRPLPYLPVIKDLVVDRTAFWEQYLRVKPWLIPPNNIPEKEFRMTPDEVDALQSAEKCIMCGACYSACTVVAMNKKYIGPHALQKAFQRVLDPRDSAAGERLEDVSGGDGAYRCHTIFNCIDACPKNLDPTKAIETLRRLALKRKRYDASRQERQKTLNDPIIVGGGE